VPRAAHTFDVPNNNEFVAVHEHGPADFRYSPDYLDIARSDDVVFIQITANNTRTLEQKKALFRRIAQLLSDKPGLRPEDVFINLVEVVKENWSLGHGQAQYAAP
jgi:phenylpyruvate tautomerase PptA (4-oxalocrotonate tautomerase family)